MENDMNGLDIRDIQCIIAIAEHGHITDAARSLHMTQPALSLFLKKFEQRLGLKLFNRIGKRFDLSYAGQRFVEEGRRIVQMRDSLRSRLEEIVNSDCGELRFGLPLLRGITLLPHTLPAFKRMFPNVRVVVREEDASLLEKLVLDGDIDFAMFNSPIDNVNLHSELISSEEIVLCAARDHFLARHSVVREGCRHPWIDIKICAEAPFLLNYPSQRTYQIAQEIFHDAGFTPIVALQLKSLITTVALCALGYGVCFASERYVNYTLQDFRAAAYSIGEPCVTMDLVASYRRDAHLSRYARKFIELCREAYQTRL